MIKIQLFFNRFFALVITLIVMTSVVGLPGNEALAQPNKNRNFSNLSIVSQIAGQCETAKQETLQKLKSPLRPNPKTELSRHINLFRAAIRKALKREQAIHWEKEFMLDQLQQTLRQEENDLELVDRILDMINGNESEFKRASFVRWKQALEKYRPLLWLQNQQLLLDEVETVFDSLPEWIESYLESPDADNTDAVSEVLEYLSEFRTTDELIASIRQLIVCPNLKVRVGSDVMTPLFLQDNDEPVTVNDNILGTWVRGSGQWVGKSRASFVPSYDSAIIRVTLQGQLSTTTVGANGPVRVHSRNTAEITTIKDIIVSSDSIRTTRASTDARQASQITHVDYTRPGPMVQIFAPSQIQSRKPASDAESERLTKLRFNARVDKAVDENVKSFSENFSQMLGGWSGEKGLQVQFDRMATTYRELVTEATVGNGTQLTTMTRPPAMTTRAGVFLQLHESLADNVGACELSGKTLVEEQVMAKLRQQFPQWFDDRETGESGNEPSLTISFSNRPIRVTFADNVIKVVVETTAIERNGNSYPGMVIELSFRLEPMDGGFQLVAAAPPEVLPIGFDRKDGQLTVRETTIRAIVMKKLGRLTAEPMEWKELEIEGKNAAIMFKPVCFSAKDGWLSIGLDVME